MSEYTPPFHITNEILSYVASISEKIGKLEDGTPNWDYITISGEPRFEIGNFYNDNN